ncbi:hypothetical protein TSOC_005703 [Tetrabaena socialis]|uniref:phytol kinase n=1 Tax=Tetrabaena socialis TaxID=47790 RepID=A0A2J8A5N5_9CHLO|nr:hypothetical protein TSOC_005703 [Tetrabaena socialis]|eukprot:PNH07813.1 hypothetical protein TSOC_005703 [Tetrabaena socialis]
MDLADAGTKQRPGAAAAAGGAGGGPVLWPPRALRLCANPACGNLSGGCEAELGLKMCSGCRTARYCEPGCQRTHWRAGHREECARLAAAAQHGWELWHFEVKTGTPPPPPSVPPATSSTAAAARSAAAAAESAAEESASLVEIAAEVTDAAAVSAAAVAAPCAAVVAL